MGVLEGHGKNREGNNGRGFWEGIGREVKGNVEGKFKEGIQKMNFKGFRAGFVGGDLGRNRKIFLKGILTRGTN